MTASPKNNCLLGCKRPAYRRGVCEACNEAAKYARQRGLMTDEDMVKQGLLLPRRIFSNPLTVAVRQIIKKK